MGDTEPEPVLKDVDLGDTDIKLSNYEAVQVPTAANVCVLEPGSTEDILDLAEKNIIVTEPKMELISSKSKEEFGLDTGLVSAEVLLAFIISSSLQLWGVQDNWETSYEVDSNISSI